MVSWMEFVDLYMYVYMYFWEKRHRCVTLWLSIFREKWICNDTLSFYSFVSDYVWNWHVIVIYFMYGIEESNVIRENIFYNIWYIFREKQLRCENVFYCVFMTVRGTNTSWKPLIFFLNPFIWTFISLIIFHSVPILNRFIPLVIVTDITWVC